MGNQFAADLADSELSMEAMLAIHLQSNHYPPVPLSMVEPCVEAIYAVSEGLTHKQIQLPKGVSWRGYPTAPAYTIVESHHLEPWCTYDHE